MISHIHIELGYPRLHYPRLSPGDTAGACGANTTSLVGWMWVVCVACGLGARPVAELRRGKSMGKSMQEGGRGHAK